MTIGEYNTAKRARNMEEASDYRRVENQINKRLDQSHEAEMANRRAAAQSLQQWSYQQQLLHQNQQMINSINRRTYTNCNYYGNTIRCTSF